MDLHEIPPTGGAGWLTPMQQTRYEIDYLEAKEFHLPRVRFLIDGVLAGEIPHCIGLLKGKIEPKMARSDLLEAMSVYDNDDLIGKLFIAHRNSDAKAISFVDSQEILAQYVEKLADLLAKREAQSWA